MPAPTNPPLTRRTLLEWLGSATVLSLSSPLLLRCASGGGDGGGGPDVAFGDASGSDSRADASGGDGAAFDAAEGREGVPDAGAGPTSDLASACDPGASLEPGWTGAHPVFDKWGERTVDPQDLADLLNAWELRIDGMVASPRTFRLCDLIELGLQTQVTDFHCVEGWSIYDVPWSGLSLGRLLDRVQPAAGASYLKIHCQGGTYTESLPVSVAREPRTLLGVGIGGNTLPLKHGFPARVVVPRLFGYKNPKYVTRIELTDTEHVGFWPKFGYTVSGEVQPERLREGKY